MEIKLATENQTGQLANISKAAFDTDITVGCPGIGGPPNYDSEKWHMYMLKGKKLYAITADNQVIGGLLLFRDGQDRSNMNLGRIFIDPLYHRKGYGIEAMSMLEKIFPEITKWTLETPAWNIRTKNFYKKIGFIEMKSEGGSVYFQKRLGKP